MMRNFSRRDGKLRFVVLAGIIVLIFSAVVIRLIFVQLINAQWYQEKLKDQYLADKKINHPRGKIVDRFGEEMAVSIMTGSLYVDPHEMSKGIEGEKQLPKRDIPKLAADILAPVLQMDPKHLHELFTAEGRFLWVKRTIEPKDTEVLKKLIQDNKLPGLHFISESKRYYTKKRAAAQVLGFVGTDDAGLSGIELKFDKELKGQPGSRKLFIDAVGGEILGRELDPSVNKEKLSTISLTLDSKIQYVLEDAMDRAMEKTKAKGAAAIIMDPHTGEILGMASRPTFDPNNFGKYAEDTWNNRAVSMIYEPGSVFKPLVGCMGLTEGIVSPGTMFMDNGSIRIADRVIYNWDGSGAGSIPFSEIIKFSVNTGMVQLGMQLGAKRMIDYSKRFGFGTETGIELPGEESGILYNPDDMYEPDIATMAIGQGIAVSPLQVLRAICAIANGGELLQPYIVKSIVDADGTVKYEGKKTVVRNVFTQQVAAQMRDMMEQVVSSGGGRTAGIKGYRIAGKTGTAEKLAANGGYAAGQYIASFVGFVPADKPMYAMIVMLDTPQGAFYGSQVSAPVFRDTLQQILVAKGIQPQISEGLPSFEQMDAFGVKSINEHPRRPAPVVELLPGGKVKLPDFTGVDMRYAAEVLQQGHLRMKPYGSGEAYRQQPAAGTEVAEDSLVEIWFK